MLRLDKIFFDAITSDADLMQAVGGRVKSTCFEVSPDEKDNTQLPYILILDEGKQPAQTTKDDEWMPSQWRVGAGVEVGAKSPNEVDALVTKAMRAIAAHIVNLSDQGEEIPWLNEGFPQTQGVAWDWTKPCYFDVAHYQCDVDNTNDDEQEESDSGI
jgi:hypothetical protein